MAWIIMKILSFHRTFQFWWSTVGQFRGAAVRTEEKKFWSHCEGMLVWSYCRSRDGKNLNLHNSIFGVCQELGSWAGKSKLDSSFWYLQCVCRSNQLRIIHGIVIESQGAIWVFWYTILSIMTLILTFNRCSVLKWPFRIVSLNLGQRKHLTKKDSTSVGSFVPQLLQSWGKLYFCWLVLCGGWLVDQQSSFSLICLLWVGHARDSCEPVVAFLCSCCSLCNYHVGRFTHVMEIQH